MFVSILSVSIDPCDMLCVSYDEVALAPLCGSHKSGPLAEALPSYEALQKLEFILNPVLSLCHFLGSLTRLRLG